MNGCRVERCSLPTPLRTDLVSDMKYDTLSPYVTCREWMIERIRLRLAQTRMKERKSSSPHLLLLQQSLQLKIYVTRMVDLQNNLLKSFRRKLNQPRPLLIIAHRLFIRIAYAYNKLHYGGACTDSRSGGLRGSNRRG